MSSRKLQSVDYILNKIKDRENLSTDVELAQFLERKPGTISAWRTRETLDWELILTKCSDYIHELLYEEESSFNETGVSDPEEQYEDLDLSTYEQYSVELIEKVEKSPFSQSVKLHIIGSLIRILNEDLKET